MSEDAIRSVPLFASLPQNEIQRLSQCFRPRQVPAMSILLQEGMHDPRYYILIKGEVEIIKSMGQADERVLAVRQAPAFMGEMSLFSEDGRHTASVRSITELELLELERDDLDGLLRRHPDFAYEMLRTLSLRLDETEDLTIRDLREKNRDLMQANEDLEAAKKQVEESLLAIRLTLDGTVRALASMAEQRDPYTAGHQQRVTTLACAMAREMALAEDQIEGIRVAGLLHDLGKMSVPAEILNKPGRLLDMEMELIKAHPANAYSILSGIEFPWPVADIVAQHHERLDGSGYPLGTTGKAIMIEAQILAVADVVEAMSSHRPYRPALGIEAALEEITTKRGSHFAPEAVDACKKLIIEDGFELGIAS